MAGYTLKNHEPYLITGKTGAVYEIPAIPNLSLDEIGAMVRFNETADAVEKTKICKEFFLRVAPGLEAEEIGDMEYFLIFQDYSRGSQRKAGESSASRSSSRNTARR